MTFELIPQPTNQATLDRVNGLMANYNQSLLATLSTFKNQWINFWDPGLSMELMQSQLDLLASTLTVDQGQWTNALAAYFAKAQRFIAYVTVESPDAFADAVMDETGKYQKYLTPGWEYTVEESGRIVVSSSCVWSEK